MCRTRTDRAIAKLQLQKELASAGTQLVVLVAALAGLLAALVGAAATIIGVAYAIHGGQSGFALTMLIRRLDPSLLGLLRLLH